MQGFVAYCHRPRWLRGAVVPATAHAARAWGWTCRSGEVCVYYRGLIFAARHPATDRTG